MLSSLLQPVLHLSLLTSFVAAFPAIDRVDPKTVNSSLKVPPTKPHTQPKNPFKWDVPGQKPVKPAKATKPKAVHPVEVTTESTTDCNEFPDIGWGGSDAPIYKFWPRSTPLNVTCYIDVVISDTNYTFLHTANAPGRSGCYVDEMSIIEPPKPVVNASTPAVSNITRSALPRTKKPLKKAPPKGRPIVLKPVVHGEGDGPINEDDFPDPEDEEDEETDEGKRKKKHDSIELSEVLPECARPRPYQIWTTLSEALLPKDGFYMNCYQKTNKTSKKYEVQWGARHVWCWREGEEVDGNKKWWKDAHVIEEGKKGGNVQAGAVTGTGTATGMTAGGLIGGFIKWAKPEEHCWVPASALDNMVFGMEGSGKKCKDNEH